MSSVYPLPVPDDFVCDYNPGLRKLSGALLSQKYTFWFIIFLSKTLFFISYS